MKPYDLLCKHISILYRHNQAAMTRRLEPLGIGLGQYPHIIAVCENPGIRQEKLTDVLFYNKSSVARSVVSLEERGLIERRTDPADKRSYCLYPTQEGLEALAFIRDQLQQVIAELTADFSPAERDMAGLLILRMVENAAQCRQQPGEALTG